jgi:hypothetical protein
VETVAFECIHRTRKLQTSAEIFVGIKEEGSVKRDKGLTDLLSLPFLLHLTLHFHAIIFF